MHTFLKGLFTHTQTLIHTHTHTHTHTHIYRSEPRGVMVKAMDCGIEVRELRTPVTLYTYHYRAYTSWERCEPRVSSQLWVK